MYYTIVVVKSNNSGQPQQQQQKHQQHYSTTTLSLLIGYGIIIPISIYFPFYIIELLDIRSKSLRLGLCCIPMTITMSVLEALYGFVPKQAKTSLFEYLCNIAFVVRPKYIEKVNDDEDVVNDDVHNGSSSDHNNTKPKLNKFFSSTLSDESNPSSTSKPQQGTTSTSSVITKIQPDATSAIIWKSFQRYIFWFVITNVVFIILHVFF